LFVKNQILLWQLSVLFDLLCCWFVSKIGVQFKLLFGGFSVNHFSKLAHFSPIIIVAFLRAQQLRFKRSSQLVLCFCLFLLFQSVYLALLLVFSGKVCGCHNFGFFNHPSAVSFVQFLKVYFRQLFDNQFFCQKAVKCGKCIFISVLIA
jgi:hypothetical protein